MYFWCRRFQWPPYRVVPSHSVLGLIDPQSLYPRNHWPPGSLSPRIQWLPPGSSDPPIQGPCPGLSDSQVKMNTTSSYMHFRNIGWQLKINVFTQTWFHAYHCICHTGICAYHMLQVGSRDEIYIIHVVPCRGKRVSFWFDSSHTVKESFFFFLLPNYLVTTVAWRSFLCWFKECSTCKKILLEVSQVYLSISSHCIHKICRVGIVTQF